MYLYIYILPRLNNISTNGFATRCCLFVPRVIFFFFIENNENQSRTVAAGNSIDGLREIGESSREMDTAARSSANGWISWCAKFCSLSRNAFFMSSRASFFFCVVTFFRRKYLIFH